jgi:hypothetical protein
VRRGVVAAVTALLLVSSSASAAAPVKQPLLPDLVPDPAQRVQMSIEAIPGDLSPHLLLRFDSLIHNVGPGPLELRASTQRDVGDEREMSNVVQRLYTTPTPSDNYVDVHNVPAPVVYYETQDDHRHYHLRNAVQYELVSEDGLQRWPFAKHEAGFCLLDKEPAEAVGLPYYTAERYSFCGYQTPDTTNLVMGLLPGWHDRYVRELFGQWVDASLASPGHYRLGAIPDPQNAIVEANEQNNRPLDSQTVPVNVPGYLAKAVYTRTSQGAPAAVQLSADRYDGNVPGAEPPGPLQFAVIRPPSHGKLSLPTETWTRAGVITYVPDPGYVGADSFEYAARDEDHPEFPRIPPTATATVRVGQLPG